MKTKLLAVLVMLGALLVAYGLDDWVLVSGRVAATTFAPADYQRVIWGSGLASLLVAGLLVLLAWLVLRCVGRSKLLALVCIVTGLLATFPLGVWTSLPGVVWPIDLTPVMGHASRFADAGAFIAALGVAYLLLPKARADPSDAPRAQKGAPRHAA